MQLRRNEVLTGLLVLVTIAVLAFILILLGAPARKSAMIAAMQSSSELKTRAGPVIDELLIPVILATAPSSAR